MLIDDPKHPGKHIDTETGIRPISEWGTECGRGLNDYPDAPAPSIMSGARQRRASPQPLNGKERAVDVFPAYAFKNAKRAPIVAIRPSAGGIVDGIFTTVSWPNDTYGAIADPPYVWPGKPNGHA